MTKSLTNVLFIWDVNQELKDYLIKGLENHPEISLIFPEKSSNKSYLKYSEKVNIIVGWRPTKELLEKATNLSVFINPGVGVQHLIPLFKEINKNRKVILCNGHGNTYFTAQHTVALLLSLTNKIIPHHQWMVAGQWRKGDEDARSIPLRFREVGLLGYGAVNTKVHQFLAGFDVKFHILKRDWQKKRIEQYPTTIIKYTPDKLEEFLQAIDVLIIALPLTSITNELIGIKELELLGKEGLLVNIGRGEIIKEEDLFYALRNNIISGAAIDVWYNYQPEQDEQGKKFPSRFPFYELDNVILSPHRGASPMNDLRRWDEVIENIKKFSREEKNLLNIVNLDEEY